MPGQLPLGEPAPPDGRVPQGLSQAAALRPLSAYVHIPFCASRCGYCDFTTYTPAELGEHGAHQPYVQALLQEMLLARRVVPDTPPLQSVFVGGGTPTLLPVAQLGRILEHLRQTFGLAADAEVTTEANPETLTPAYLEALLQAGFTRISLGMQSAAPHVLAVLQRQHTPGQAVRAAQMARQAGFAHVNLDLIYGSPGESDTDWQRSLEQTVGAGVDHLSAYSLIVEPGTRLAAQIRRGELAAPTPDVLADRYEQAEKFLSANGFLWYEVSNWAREDSPGAQCRHNLAYWRGDNWWGFGTGAHSHLGQAPSAGQPSALRWWNVRHPRDYAARLAAGHSPAAGRELLGPGEISTEHLMLGLRLASGLPVPPGRDSTAARWAGEGLVEPAGLAEGRLVLTVRGRLLADALVRDLLDEPS